MKKFLMRNSTAAILIVLLVGNVAKAQIPTTDLLNFAQNIFQGIQQVQSVAQETQAVINQATQIRNQITALENQARQLRSLPEDTFNQIRDVFDQNVRELEGLLRNAEGIGMDAQAINGQFDQFYPDNAAWEAEPTPDYQRFYDQWNEQASQSARTAMEGQAVITRVAANNQRVAAILQSSSGADGEVRQLQAMNQTLGVVSSQLSDLTTSMATSARLSATVSAQATAQQAMSTNMGARMNVVTPRQPMVLRRNLYYAPTPQ